MQAILNEKSLSGKLILRLKFYWILSYAVSAVNCLFVKINLLGLSFADILL